MFQFIEDSVIVRIWAMRVIEKKSTMDDVPRLFNLREMVVIVKEKLEEEMV